MAEGSNPRVAIELWVDDQGTMHVREFKDQFNANLDEIEKKNQTITDRIKAGWNGIKSAWVEVTAGLLALREAWGMMNMAAKAEQEKQAFSSMAASFGSDATKMIESLKQVSHGAVAEADLVRNAGTAMMMGLQPEAITAMMKIAAATAKQTGQDITKSFNDITLASARESKMILDNLGILIDLEKAYDDYAQANHTTAEALTDAQRKQAFMNAALKEGGDLIQKLGNQGKTKADELQALAATFANIKVAVGDAALVLYDNKGFVGALAAIHLLLPQVATGAAAVITSVRSLSGAAFTLSTALGMIQAGLTAFVLAYKGSEWLVMHEHLKGIADETDRLNRANNEVAKKLADISKATGVTVISMAAFNQAVKDGRLLWDESTKSWIKGKDAIKANAAAVGELTDAEKKMNDARQKLVDDAKKLADEQGRATEEMYSEAGIDADRYFEREASKLVEKAAKWKKYGGDTLQVEEWLYNELGKLSEEAWGKGEELAGIYLDNMQTQTQILTDSFNAAAQTMEERLDAFQGKAQQIDGTTIGLYATFDGSAVMQGLDELIAKFRALQASATAPSAPSSGPPENHWDESTEEWLDRTGGNSRTVNNATIVNNFNQQISRGDAVAIAEEQRRREARR
jgi:hypothetical protein